MKVPNIVQQFSILSRNAVNPKKILKSKFFLVIIVIALLFVLSGSFVQATDGNKIHGKVVDENGNPVSNANVTLTAITMPERTRRTYETTTNSTGHYEFVGYDVIEFSITASKNGSSTGKYLHLYYSGQSKKIILSLETEAR